MTCIISYNPEVVRVVLQTQIFPFCCVIAKSLEGSSFSLFLVLLSERSLQDFLTVIYLQTDDGELGYVRSSMLFIHTSFSSPYTSPFPFLTFCCRVYLCSRFAWLSVSPGVGLRESCYAKPGILCIPNLVALNHQMDLPHISHLALWCNRLLSF